MATFLFSRSQSFEMLPSGKDTVNMTDANGKKQGLWILTCIHNRPCKCGNISQVLEKGMYKDNKRVGEWLEFYCNSNIKAKLNYINGRPGGEIIFYNENGNMREQGTWANNRWVGNYKSISDNGDITEIVFDDKGKEVSKKITPSKKAVPSKKK